MFVDNSLKFSASQAITTTADSSSVVDLSGAGSGTAVPFTYGEKFISGLVFGEDIGSGEGVAVPYVFLNVEVGGTTSETLTVSLSGMIDNGSNAPGTATVMYSSPAMTCSTLTAGKVLIFPVPPITPGQAKPRFLKLTYTCSSTLSITVSARIVLNPPTTLLVGNNYPENFVAV